MASGRVRIRDHPDAGDAAAPVVRALSMLPNSLALIGAQVATLGLGFLFWLLAARLFAADVVGLAAGVVAAVLLCVQLALLGVGSAVIALFPESRARPGRLLDTALTLAVVTGLVAGGLFLALAAGVFPELGIVGRSPAFGLLFAVMSALGTVGVVLDQASTTLRRGDQALVRGVLNGILSLAALGTLAVAAIPGGSMAIFACWVVGGAAACALGAVQLDGAVARYRYRPRLARRTARRLIAVGLPNHALTLADRAPGLLLPVLVTEVLSPTANAYWYAVWMMAWLVFVVPVQVGMTLFAEAADRPHDTERLVTHGVRSSLAIGLAAAVVLAALADVALSLLGPEYAAAGATPLRVLVWGVVPLAFVQAYYARCRAARRLGEAVAAAVIFGALAVAASILAGAGAGLTALAAAWLGCQTLAGVWAVLRLRALGTAASVVPPGRNRAVALPRLRGEEWT
jgi:O-antigen/teichoic acid export membrane protein